MKPDNIISKLKSAEAEIIPTLELLSGTGLKDRKFPRRRTKLTVIIVSFNTREYTLACLKSLRDQNLDLSAANYQVIVFDNGSTDGTLEAIANLYPWVKLIANRKNLGFAAGNNRALKLARGEFVLLLNSDTLVLADTLPEMLQFMDRHPRAGAATARVELADGGLDLACHRGFPTPWNSFCYFFGLEKLFPEIRIFSGYHQTYRDFNRPHEVDAISGAFFFLRSEVIRKVGLLDERFFMYAEDLDWCLRIKSAGFEIFYNPNAKIIHFKKQSGRKKSTAGSAGHQTQLIRRQSTDHFYETMKLFYDKHYQDKYPPFLRSLVLAGIWLLAKLKKI